jgi:hypothetical protein
MFLVNVLGLGVIVVAMRDNEFRFEPIDWDAIEKKHTHSFNLDSHDFSKDSFHAEQPIIDEGEKDAKLFDVGQKSFVKHMMELRDSAIKEIEGERVASPKDVDLVPKLRKLKLR